MARRPAMVVGVVAAVALIAEAVGIVLLHWILGQVAQRQEMSLGGLEPRLMTVGTWIVGVLFGLYLLLCAALLLTSAVRGRVPGRFGRIVLITCAVVHGVLGALTVGLVGWAAFAVLMVVLGLIVFSLLAFDGDGGENRDTTGAPVTDPSPGPKTA